MRRYFKESAISNKRIFDFTNNDPDEVVFSEAIAMFNLMKLTADEVQKLGIPFDNSLSGAYGLYRTGNGILDAVVCDYENREPVYTYKIIVYQTQDTGNGTDCFEELVEHFNNILSHEDLKESAEMGNESFELLNKNDKNFIQGLIKDTNLEDLGLAIEDYADECIELEEVKETNVDAWKQQLYDYAASVDSIKESSKKSSKKLKEVALNPPEDALTVGQVIEALSKFPKDWPLRVYTYDRSSIQGGCEGWGWVDRVTRAQYDDDGVSISAHHGERKF